MVGKRPFAALHGKEKASCSGNGREIIFPAAFPPARAALPSPPMPDVLRAHLGALAAKARQAAGRAAAGIFSPLSKSGWCFCRGAAVVRLEQAGNVHPERTGHAVPAACRDALGPLVERARPASAFCSTLPRLEGDIAWQGGPPFLAAHARKHHQHAWQAGRAMAQDAMLRPGALAFSTASAFRAQGSARRRGCGSITMHGRPYSCNISVLLPARCTVQSR